MALGTPLLPDPAQGWTGQNGAGAEPRLQLHFDGSSQGRVTHEAGEPLVEDTYSYKLTVFSTNGNDAFVLTVGGGSTGLIAGSDAPGVYPGTVECPASSDLIRLTGDSVEGVAELQVWQGVAD